MPSVNLSVLFDEDMQIEDWKQSEAMSRYDFSSVYLQFHWNLILMGDGCNIKYSWWLWNNASKVKAIEWKNSRGTPDFEKLSKHQRPEALGFPWYEKQLSIQTTMSTQFEHAPTEIGSTQQIHQEFGQNYHQLWKAK